MYFFIGFICFCCGCFSTNPEAKALYFVAMAGCHIAQAIADRSN